MREARRCGGRILVLCLAMAFAISLTGPLHAFQLTVSPPTVELAVQPGKIAEGSLIVSGRFDRPTRIRATVGCWSLKRDGQLTFTDGPAGEPRSLAGWLVVAPAEFMLTGQRSQVVRYRLKVPEDITGGYWGALFFQNIPEGDEPAKGTAVLSVVGRVAVLFQVQTQRGSVRDGALSEVAGKWSAEGLFLRAAFVNRGNLMVRVKGRFELLAAKTGKFTAKIPIAEALVLPGGTRDLTAKWTGDLEPGPYLLRAVVDYGGPSVVAGQRVIKIEDSKDRGTEGGS